jgi:transcriptional regulator with XRE-family HTH domain
MQLERYLEVRGIPVADFAMSVGVAEQTIYRYLQGTRFPRPDVMRKITKATSGKVAPSDWYREETE